MNDGNRKYILIAGGTLLVFGMSILYWSNKNDSAKDMTTYRSSGGFVRTTASSKITDSTKKVQAPKQIALESDRQDLGPKKRMIDRVHPYVKSDLFVHHKSPSYVDKIKYEGDEQPIEVGGSEYFLAKDIYAVDKSRYDNRGEVVGEKLEHLLVETSNPGNHYKRVMVKNSNAKLAIFTGVLKLKLVNFDDLAILELPGDFEIQESYPNLNWALLQFFSYQDTMESFHILRNSPLVEMVEIELLQYERSGR